MRHFCGALRHIGDAHNPKSLLILYRAEFKTGSEFRPEVELTGSVGHLVLPRDALYGEYHVVHVGIVVQIEVEEGRAPERNLRRTTT